MNRTITDPTIKLLNYFDVSRYTEQCALPHWLDRLNKGDDDDDDDDDDETDDDDNDDDDDDHEDDDYNDDDKNKNDTKTQMTCSSDTPNCNNIVIAKRKMEILIRN